MLARLELTLKNKVLSIMQNTENHLQTLSEIKNLMERSSRFISLSGLSGVAAGIFALMGAWAANRFGGIPFLEQFIKKQILLFLLLLNLFF